MKKNVNKITFFSFGLHAAKSRHKIPQKQLDSLNMLFNLEKNTYGQ